MSDNPKFTINGADLSEIGIDQWNYWGLPDGTRLPVTGLAVFNGESVYDAIMRTLRQDFPVGSVFGRLGECERY